MKSYLFIGAGGFLGAISRYFIECLHLNAAIPINTLVINISGCFILSFFLSLLIEIKKVDENLSLGIATGFLGAFTTFSTFCKEIFILSSDERYFSAVLYLLLSAALGLTAAYIGFLTARIVYRKLFRVKKDDISTECEISGQEGGVDSD